MRILDYMERLQTLTRLLKKEHTGSEIGRAHV